MLIVMKMYTNKGFPWVRLLLQSKKKKRNVINIRVNSPKRKNTGLTYCNFFFKL